MSATALREAREGFGLTQKELGDRLFLSGSMINEIEHGRKKIPRGIRPVLARQMDQGHLYIEIAREATGNVMVGPYLNNVDNHRLVGILKYKEEVLESLEALATVMPQLMKRPDQLTPSDINKIEEAMLEMVEATTAAQNTLTRLAKEYNVSLAELWDKHQEEVVKKGYLIKEK
jgi:transcriptional regulator with XRE-family HTH domain